MNNLFSIRVKCVAGNSSGIYVKTNVVDYDLVLFSYHSIINEEGKPEDYKLYYYDGTYEKIEVIEEKKYTKEDGDLVIAKVKKLEDRFRSKIEDTFFEDSKEGEKLSLRGFPQKLSNSISPFQKLNVTINDQNLNEKFHQFEFESKNGSIPEKDDTQGMSGSPIFKKGKEYVRLKGMYLEIRDKENTFGMGHFLKSEKIKKCLKESCPEYDFGISEVLIQKIEKIIDEIKNEFLECFELYSDEEKMWRDRFSKLKEIVFREKDVIIKNIENFTCKNYDLFELVENPCELKSYIRCLLSAIICESFNITKDYFINFINKYSYLSPSLDSKYPKVELAKAIQFLHEKPNYQDKNIFVKYKPTKNNCRNCVVNEENLGLITADLTLLPNQQPNNFMNFSTSTKIKVKCAGCFSDIRDTLDYEMEEKWGKNKEFEI